MKIKWEMGETPFEYVEICPPEGTLQPSCLQQRWMQQKQQAAVLSAVRQSIN